MYQSGISIRSPYYDNSGVTPRVASRSSTPFEESDNSDVGKAHELCFWKQRSSGKNIGDDELSDKQSHVSVHSDCSNRSYRSSVSIRSCISLGSYRLERRRSLRSVSETRENGMRSSAVAQSFNKTSSLYVPFQRAQTTHPLFCTAETNSRENGNRHIMSYESTRRVPTVARTATRIQTVIPRVASSTVSPRQRIIRGSPSVVSPKSSYLNTRSAVVPSLTSPHGPSVNPYDVLHSSHRIVESESDCKPSIFYYKLIDPASAVRSTTPTKLRQLSSSADIPVQSSKTLSHSPVLEPSKYVVYAEAPNPHHTSGVSSFKPTSRKLFRTNFHPSETLPEPTRRNPSHPLTRFVAYKPKER